MRIGSLIFLLIAGCSHKDGGFLIGKGDGSASSVTLTSIYQTDRPRSPSGLDFNPLAPDDLWVVDYQDNTVITIHQPGSASQTVEVREDPAANHFMHKPVAISFGTDNSWGVCGENDNHQWGEHNFMGPAVFSADPAIFATQNETTMLGSHLDMLHASPFCMGITHEKDHVYWAFDGMNGAIVRYDFKQFHPPGEDDHSDGVIDFYVTGQVERAAGTPSNLAFDPADAQLYVADTGHGRVVKLDTRSGAPGGKLASLEPSIPTEIVGAKLGEFVPPGTLSAPSGLALHQGVLYVTDAATSRIHAYDRSGEQLRHLDTGLPANALAGITVGPDGKLYLVDRVGSQVLRVDVP
jgi:DNA-binding beta-propeller fold protein YncE